MRRVVVTCGMALLSASAVAQDSFELLGVDAVTAALGGASTASSEGGASTYYAPSNLAFCKDSSVTVRGSYFIQSLRTEVPSGDAPGVAPGNRLGVSLGMCLRLPHGLALGVAVDSSGTNLLGLSVSTPTLQPQWLMNGAALERPSILAGLAWAPREDLAIGLGLSATLKAGLGLAIGIPAFEDGTVQVGADLSAQPALGVIASVSYRPSIVKIGLTYRQAHYVSVTGSLPLRLDEGGEVALVELALATPYVPHQIALGVAVDALPSLTVMADVTWYNWRGYTGAAGGFGPYLQAAPGQSETLPEEANAADLLSYGVANVVFRNTFSPRVGIEYRWRDRLAVRGGYHYRMSPYPVPDDTQTNLLDRDTHTMSLGLGYTVRVGQKGQPFEERRHRLSIDAYGRLGVMGLVTYSNAEATSYQDITYGGNLIDMGLGLTYGWL